jgi:hypothetical protein
VLRLANDLTHGTDLKLAQIRRWQALYAEQRGGGEGKITMRHLRLSLETETAMAAIGVYLEQRFTRRNVNVRTQKGLLNGRLLCAFAVYYALEVE